MKRFIKLSQQNINLPTRAQFITELEISVFYDDCNKVVCALRIESVVQQQRVIDVLCQKRELNVKRKQCIFNGPV